MSDKTVVEKLRETAKHAREERGLPVYTPDQLEKLADAIEREYLPRPRFSNDEPIHFGDWFTAEKYGVKEPEQLKRLCIFSPELLREWKQDNGEKFAFELNYTRPADLDFRFDKCEKPKPDSLERIEEDASKLTCEYFNRDFGDCENCEGFGGCREKMLRDLLRRQRAVLENK